MDFMLYGVYYVNYNGGKVDIKRRSSEIESQDGLRVTSLGP